MKGALEMSPAKQIESKAVAKKPSASPTLPASPLKPCEPLTAERVWSVVEEVFRTNEVEGCCPRADRRGHDERRGCFWMLVEGVPPHVFDVCMGQIGTRLETDFTVCASGGKDGRPFQFLVAISEMQNLTSDETAAERDKAEEWQEMRRKAVEIPY